MTSLPLLHSGNNYNPKDTCCEWFSLRIKKMTEQFDSRVTESIVLPKYIVAVVAALSPPGFTRKLSQRQHMHISASSLLLILYNICEQSPNLNFINVCFLPKGLDLSPCDIGTGTRLAQRYTKKMIGLMEQLLLCNCSQRSKSRRLLSRCSPYFLQ